MLKKFWVVLFVLTLGGCRIVSQKELADLKSTPNPHLSNVDKLWQDKIVPQVVNDARPASDLMSAFKAAKDIDSACKSFGYRSQDENPCIFYVKTEGKITKIDTASRSGKMTVQDATGVDTIVQIGPTIRGTQLRDAYKGASYGDFNDQVLFGDYGRAINDQAVKMIQSSQLKVGNAVQVYGVFFTWDVPETIPDVTPAKIVSAGGQ